MKETFEAIVSELILKDDVEKGRMMSSPALKFENKVFAFYHDHKMCFKLGDTSLVESRSLPVILLSPFKTKGPLKGWFWVAEENSGFWRELALSALDRISTK